MISIYRYDNTEDVLSSVFINVLDRDKTIKLVEISYL